MKKVMLAVNGDIGCWMLLDTTVRCPQLHTHPHSDAAEHMGQTYVHYNNSKGQSLQIPLAYLTVHSSESRARAKSYLSVLAVPCGRCHGTVPTPFAPARSCGFEQPGVPRLHCICIPGSDSYRSRLSPARLASQRRD